MISQLIITLLEIVMTPEKSAEEKGGVDDGQAGHVGVHDVVGPKLFSWDQFNNFGNLVVISDD